MKKFILFLILLLSPLIAFAGGKPIKGAFGITLGQKFDPKQAIGKASLTDGTPMYEFKPKKPFRAFTEYYVLITPKTHKVYSIWGIGKVENTQKCEKEQNFILTALERKYGIKPPDNELIASLSSLYGAKLLQKDGKTIVIKCTGLTDDYSISISYTDDKLEKVAEKERIELETENTDTGGL